MDLNLKGKTAIVTGGAQGLGKAICRQLTAEGANVAVNYRASEAKAKETASELAAEYGVKTKAIKADIASEADVRALFAETKKRLGIPQILVNNSGVCPVTMIKDTPLSEWQTTMDINLTGTFLTNREMANMLIAKGMKGAIVNITSPVALIGSKRGKTAYGASKGGMLSFTVSFAKEVAQYGIRVNALAPGMMYTQMTADVLDAEEEKYNDAIPLGRIGTVEEVAKMVVVTASDASSYMTGALVDVSGGVIGR